MVVKRTIAQELDPIFKARSVAVIGASNTPPKWGYSIMERLVKGGFQGPVYPVNPKEASVMNLRSYPDVKSIPQRVDLAVFAIPAHLVPKAMEDAIASGIRGALVISAGFAESGDAGYKLQEQLTAIVRSSGIRMIGPNCNGMWSSDTSVSLSSPKPIKPGSVAFISQSGAFGGMLVSQAEEKGYGLSKFVSSGNQADLNEADYIAYLAQDPSTKVIVLYMEGVRDGRKFMEAAKNAVRHKPIIIYKPGSSDIGTRAVQSHTGSMMMPDSLFDSVCKQVGIIRAKETSHLFDMAEALANAPLPPVPGIGIISMTGGQCVVSSDTCAQLGLDVPEIDQTTQRYLAQNVLAGHAPAPRNPIDIAGDFRTPLTFAEIAEAIAPLPSIGVLLISPPSQRSGAGAAASEEAARRIAAIPLKFGKPVIALGMSPTASPLAGSVAGIFQEAGIPGYQKPEDAARAAYALVKYANIKASISLR